MTDISFLQRLHSGTNRWFLSLRSFLRFKRSGYKEEGSKIFSTFNQTLLSAYRLQSIDKLSAYSLKKNIQTIDWLEKMLTPIDLSHVTIAVDAGCQDFIRLPALRAFLKYKKAKACIHGIEVDAFPVLNDLHSRWDRAHYYISLEDDGSEYHVANFFNWQCQADIIFCFYPFVSMHPTLKWGLPLEFVSAQKWIAALERALRPAGYALVIHHTLEEERIWDDTRASSSLKLIYRQSLANTLLPKSQAFASVYRLSEVVC